MKIGKVFNISYAHRLMNHPGKCKHLHGHNGKVEIQIKSTIDPDTDMVIDFDEITQKVKWQVDELLDHSTILHKDDPLAVILWGEGEKVVALNRHPTAEILSSLIYDITIQNIDSLGLFKCSVGFWETEDSYAECSESEGVSIIQDLGLEEEYDKVEDIYVPR